MKQLVALKVPIWYGAKQHGPEVGPDWLIDNCLVDLLFTGHRSIIADVPVPKSRRRGGIKDISYIDEISSTVASVHTLATYALHAGDHILCIGGDHSASIGMMTAVAEHARKTQIRTLVLYIDNHGDAHTPDTTLTGRVYGMTIPIAMGIAHKHEFAEKNIPCVLHPNDIIHIGGGDIERDEYIFFGLRNIPAIDLKVINKNKPFSRANFLIDTIAPYLHGYDRVHIELDLDVLCERDMPAVINKNRNGISLTTLLPVLKFIQQTGKLHSASIVEFAPHRTTRPEEATRNVFRIAQQLFP